MKHKSLFVSSIGVTVVLVLGYLISFVREVIIANYYGISNNVDAYAIALQIPVTLFAFISVSIRSVVIPLYSELLYNKGPQRAATFINQLIMIISLITLVLIVLFEIFAGGLIHLFAPGFDSQTHVLAVQLLRILLPCAVFTPIGQIFTAVLNVHKQFVWASFAVLFLNISVIIFILLFHHEWGIKSACIGNIVGVIVEISFLTMLTYKYINVHSTKINLRDFYLKKALKMTFPVLWSMSITEVNTMINRMIASMLFVGSIAALSYASKINSIIMQFFVSAIATIVYPLYAESSAKGNITQLNQNINKVMSIYVMILLPIMVIIFTLKREIIEIAFMRGQFDSTAVDVIQELLGLYTIGLLFMSLRETITKVFYSLGDTKTPARNATVGVILNIILNVTLPFVIGINGLALATALTSFFISSRLLFKLKKNYQEVKLGYFFNNLKKILLSCLLMLIVVILVYYFTSFNKWLTTAVVTISGIITYLTFVFMLRIPIAISLKEKLLKKY